MIENEPLPDPKTVITFLRSNCKLVSGLLKVVKITPLRSFTFRLINSDIEKAGGCNSSNYSYLTTLSILMSSAFVSTTSAWSAISKVENSKI